jgi:hypothetical protein
MRSGKWAPAALAALIPALAAAQPERMSTHELEALRPAPANRTAQRDLLSILEPVKAFRSGMFLRLRGVTFATRPYGTEVDGVCRRDALHLRYALAEAGTVDKDAPLRPYGVEATALFHVAHLPRSSGKPSDASPVQWTSDCHVGEDASWFEAKDAQEAAKVAGLLAMARDQVKAGAVKLAPCNVVVERGQSCAQQVLAAADPGRIEAAEACDAPEGSICYKINLPGQITLTVVAAVDGEDAPTAIRSVSAGSYVIVT